MELALRLLPHHRGACYFVVSALLGVLGAVCSDLSASGMMVGSIPAAIILALVWTFASPLLEFLSAPHRSTLRLAQALLWLIATPVFVGVVWGASSPVLPDAGKVYFWVWHSYIESSWKTDPQTGIIYFPIRYTRINQGAMKAPQYLLVFDKERRFSFVPFSDQLSSPSCPEAKYSARRVYDRVYLLAAFADDPSAPFHPCLVTPIPTESSGNG
jgi:hypothetical protein